MSSELQDAGSQHQPAPMPAQAGAEQTAEQAGAEPMDGEPMGAEPMGAEQLGAAQSWPTPALGTALRRGLAGCCPACGQSRLFCGWLGVISSCPHCGAPLGAVPADDAPPYFVILIAGHIVGALVLWTEQSFTPPLWIEAAIFLPLTLILTLGLLRPVKGAVLGVMLRNNMFRDTAGETS